MCRILRRLSSIICRALAAAFRGAMLNALAKTGLTPPPTPRRWIVHCKKAGRGLQALQYLSRYLYLGVISDRNLIADDGNNITFRYKDSNRPANTPSYPGLGS